MPPRLHHVGVIMPTEEEAAEYAALFGLEEDYRGEVPEFECLCIFMKGHGASPVELVVPRGGPLARFNRGFGGLHHYALQVDSLDAVRDALLAKEIPMLQPEHVKGAGPFLCNFVDPRFTRGVLTEYIQVF